MHADSTTRQSQYHAYEPATAWSLVSMPGCTALYVVGDTTVLARPAVAIVGSRRASDEGLARAAEVAVKLVGRGYVLVSGLAAGIDAAAHEGAIRAGGRTIAVIGTSLDRVYPAEHAALQEHVYREHLLVSPFAAGSKLARWHFPARNKVMARLAQATVLVEATEQSGTRHQVEACLALGRTAYVRRGLVEGLSWLRCARGQGVVE